MQNPKGGEEKRAGVAEQKMPGSLPAPSLPPPAPIAHQGLQWLGGKPAAPQIYFGEGRGHRKGILIPTRLISLHELRDTEIYRWECVAILKTTT